MSNTTKTILVIGATGAMGSNVIEHLLLDTQNQWRIRAFTRNVNSDRALALAQLSDRVEFFQGDTNDAEALRAAMQGVYGVYCNTDMWSALNPANFADEPSYLEASRDSEIQQGQTILQLAKTSGVKHFVYSSLDYMNRLSNNTLSVPHSDAKGIVQDYIEVQRQHDSWYRDHVSVLQTTSYFENFQSYFQPRPRSADDPTLVFTVPMADKPWTMIALDDIGEFARYIFANPQTTLGRTLAVASDRLTMKEVVATFTKVTGIPAVYEPITLDEYRGLGFPGATDMGNMFEFLQTYGCDRDFDFIDQIHPHRLTFEQWLRKTGWKG
jgi:uncharacterized protein YbjT (DUF2867 family)